MLAILGAECNRSACKGLQMVRKFDEIRVWSRTPNTPKGLRNLLCRSMGREEAVRAPMW